MAHRKKVVTGEDVMREINRLKKIEEFEKLINETDGIVMLSPGFAQEVLSMCRESIVERAKMVGYILHCSQKYGDEDYFYHLTEVHNCLEEFGVTDQHLLAAAYLHDSVEDTSMKLSVVEKFFGILVSNLVYCVTNEVGANRKERNIKTYPKMKASSGARKLKLADRISNVRNSIRTNNTGMMKMYAKEHDMFRYFLFDETKCDDIESNMWKLLDSLMEVVCDKKQRAAEEVTA